MQPVQPSAALMGLVARLADPAQLPYRSNGAAGRFAKSFAWRASLAL